MIQSLEIQNFKSIKKHRFALTNLNVLLGLNGMGKSSFIQSLLLLRQSRLQEGLSLNGDLVRLGNSRDVLYQYAQEEKIYFHLSLSEASVGQLAYRCPPEVGFLPIAAPDPGELHWMYEWAVWESDIQYLNANRLEPTSLHPKAASRGVRALGNYGQYTAHFLLAHGLEEVAFENLIHPDSFVEDTITGQRIANRTLAHQVNLWLGEISPGVRVQVADIPNADSVLMEYEYLQPHFGTTNRFKPANVGFGISYVLPVVVALLAARRRDLIVIENPESHVHPRGQVELGRLAALTAANDVQIVVETHSDHFINGLRVAVKDGLIPRNRARIFYFEKAVLDNEQYSKITEVEIDQNGELSQYPPHMLDEWSNQLFKLM